MSSPTVGHVATHVVVHVEDDPSQAILLRHVMKARPEVELHQAATLASALDLLATVRPQLIVTDLNLPDAGGDGVIDVLRGAADAGVTIIVMTADAESCRRLQRTGLDVQAKPIDVNDFLTLLDERLLATSS